MSVTAACEGNAVVDRGENVPATKSGEPGRSRCVNHPDLVAGTFFSRRIHTGIGTDEMLARSRDIGLRELHPKCEKDP